MVQDGDEKRLLIFDVLLFDGEDVRNKSYIERNKYINQYSETFNREIKESRKNEFPLLIYCKNSWELNTTEKFLLPGWQEKLKHKCNGIVLHATDSVSTDFERIKIPIQYLKFLFLVLRIGINH